MKMNRRNVLIGLGTVVAGGGAALGTGAFSSVEADREVRVDTAGDSEALVGLEITSSTLEGEEDDTIAFDLDADGVNLDAVTRFDDGFEITNNSDNEIEIDIEDDGGDDISSSTDQNMYFEDNDGENDLGELGSEETVSLDVVFDLEDETESESTDITESITIIANQT